MADTQHIEFLNGVHNTLRLSVANAGDIAAQIGGFVRNDTIELDGLVATRDTYDPATGTLALYTASATTPAAVLDIGTANGTADFTLATSNGASFITTQRATGDGGDQALHGDVARQLYGVDGSGIIIGVISDSFNDRGGLAADIASGDLPAATMILEDDPLDNGSDEGRAMAELIHRIAPGATIEFYSGEFQGQDGFAAGVSALVGAGADIIVDDLTLPDEPFFQDGSPVQAAIASAMAAGVDYFTAAGNSGRLYYQGNFTALSTTLPGFTQSMNANDFDGGNPLQAISLTANQSIDYLLQWDQPFAGIGGSSGSANSLSMYLFDSAGNLAASATVSALGGDPEQELLFQNGDRDAVYRLAIVWDKGNVAPGLFKYIDEIGDPGFETIDDPNAGQGSGDLVGHEQQAGVNSVGAVDYIDTPAFGTTPAQLEDYSSVGPGEILFGADGQRLPSPESPGAPQFVSVDGPSTHPLNPFFGTSAAAPDAAAVAALMLEANPGLTTAQVTALLAQSAVSLGLPMSEQGAGLIQADLAVALAEAAACYLVGTRIAVPGTGGSAAEVPIETLRIGDHVVTAFGAVRRIRWIGTRAYDQRFAAGNPAVLPIRIRARCAGRRRPAARPAGVAAPRDAARRYAGAGCRLARRCLGGGGRGCRSGRLCPCRAGNA